jgi:regulator of sigma E protease
MSVFTLRMLGRMLVGEASWRTISGPVTIAEYAGRTARIGLEAYLDFLALISISIGVLNLLPIPMLDGGHLLFYVAEALRGGRPVPERIRDVGFRLGLATVMGLMVLALFNDFERLFS